MLNKKKHQIQVFSNDEKEGYDLQLTKLLLNSPIPHEELSRNLGVYLTPGTLSRLIFLNNIYKQIIDQQGIILDCGCRWGQTSSIFSSLRGIYEPFNRLRKIYSFDTFHGFIEKSKFDHNTIKKNQYSVSKNYQNHLGEVLKLNEKLSPNDHLKKNYIIKGDISKTIKTFFNKNKHAIVSLAYLDLDLFKTTYDALKEILKHSSKGTIIVFDELNDEYMPGETVALKKILNLKE